MSFMIYGMFPQTKPTSPKSSSDSVAIASIGALAVAGLFDIATGESLSMTENSPATLIYFFRALDVYTSPLALVCVTFAIFLWFRGSKKFLIWFDIVLALALVALLNNLAGLIVSIFDPKVKASFLLLSASLVYLENIAVFVAFYWRFDHKWQNRISMGEKIHPAVMFPQNSISSDSMRGWRPSFIDYLFLSFNTASTFGPTLPIPLRSSVHIGMMMQVSIAMAVLIMIAARAIGLIA
ncbi:hypothetical protein LBMAG51_04320 [Phycisphaerae bacterium]|nr:hypothetical protein LBMAG51_04320 [Phycisphaerae bacterium]